MHDDAEYCELLNQAQNLLVQYKEKVCSLESLTAMNRSKALQECTLIYDQLLESRNVIHGYELLHAPLNNRVIRRAL